VPHLPTTRSHLVVLLFTLLLVAPDLAEARDFDRNDLIETSYGGALAVAPRASHSIGMLGRVAVRRHRRRLFLGGEGLLGAGLTPLGLAVGVTGFVGLETSDNGWDRLRGYGQVGIGGVHYGSGSLINMPEVHAEVGARVMLQNYRAPHTMVEFGVRPVSDFYRWGVLVHLSLAFAFD